jgi:hypothetical protein
MVGCRNSLRSDHGACQKAPPDALASIVLGCSKSEVERLLGPPELIENSVTAQGYSYFRWGIDLLISYDPEWGVIGITYYNKNKYYQQYPFSFDGIKVSDSIKNVLATHPNLKRCLLAEAIEYLRPKLTEVRPFAKDTSYVLKCEAMYESEDPTKPGYDVYVNENGEILQICVVSDPSVQCEDGGKTPRK